nr:hypothetical protein [Streptococcus mutans]
MSESTQKRKNRCEINPVSLIKEKLMELKSKTLSLVQLLGYEENHLPALPADQLCREVYGLGQEFIEDMMDIVYSDGPVYFKSYPFSETKSVTIFTTFGNKVRPTGEDIEPLFFEEKLLIDSSDFAGFSANDLQDYYDSLASKYTDSDLNNLVVYHVLYHPEAGLMVDAYSSWEEQH